MVGILKSQWQMSHPNKTTHRLYQPSTMTKPWWTGKPIHALQLTSCKPNHLAEVSGTILIKLAQKSGSPAFICKQAFLIWWTNSALRMLFFFEYIHSTLGLPLQSCPEVLLETQVYIRENSWEETTQTLQPVLSFQFRFGQALSVYRLTCLSFQPPLHM